MRSGVWAGGRPRAIMTPMSPHKSLPNLDGQTRTPFSRQVNCLLPLEPVRRQHNVQFSMSPDEAPGSPGAGGGCPRGRPRTLYLNTRPGVCAPHNASTIPAHLTHPGAYTHHALATLTPAGFGQSPRQGRVCWLCRARGGEQLSTVLTTGKATSTSGHPEPACGRRLS